MLCGLEIQKEINQQENFQVRMGIHVAEIVFTDQDAFGDGMNVASRICSVANGGEICLSDGVYQNIRNREELAIENLGFVVLKNIDQPLLLHKITV